MSTSDQLFLEQYQKELSYLKEAGAQFAKEYPKIAKRLEWDGEESKDPHVERLIESFAFLISKLQRNIDDRFPIISNALLSSIYPQFLAPVPSMSIAHFTMEKAKANPGYNIPKGTYFLTHSQEDVTCKFQTSYDLNLWPISVLTAEVFVKDGLHHLPKSLSSSSHVLKLHLKANGFSFEDVGHQLKELTFYLSGEKLITSVLYDSLFFAEGRIIVEDKAQKNMHILPPNALRNVGFTREEDVIPSSLQSHAAYRLLQEFFTFPQKFLFFKIADLELSGLKNDLVLYIPLTEKIASHSSSISPDNFLLNCTPIVNIFKKTTEPLKISQKETEYRLIPDSKRWKTTEIHSIEKISAVLANQSDRTDLPAYFSFDFKTSQTPDQIYWFSTRKKNHSAVIPGSDLWLNFVDFNFRSELPATDVVWGDVWCTNRFAAAQIPAGGKLTPQDPLPCGKVSCLHAPTEQFLPADSGEAQWRLIAQLNLNHLSLLETDRFKNILQLYVPLGESAVSKEIQGILNITSEPKVRRIVNEAWRGFVQGLGIEITLDERQFMGSSLHLFCDILHHFFGLYVSFNSFTELSLKTNKRDYSIKKWGPLCGYQRLL